MRFAINTVSKGLMLAFFIFTCSELIAPGSAANFVSLSGLFLLLFLFIMGSLLMPHAEENGLNPIVSVMLTLAVLASTIFFTWTRAEELGKVRVMLTLGAAMVTSVAWRIIFREKE